MWSSGQLTENGMRYVEKKEEVVHRGWLTVAKRHVLLPDGGEKAFEILKAHDAVFVLPFHTKTRCFSLIREYYPGPNSWQCGLIAGLFEPTKHESPLDAAKSELAEEARLTGGRWISLTPPDSKKPTDCKDGDCCSWPTAMPYGKYSSQRYFPFLVLDPLESEHAPPRDASEFIIVEKDVPIDELAKLVDEGRLTVPNTCGALMGLRKIEELKV